MPEDFLALDNLTKRFADHVAVDRLSLTIPRGDVLALLGPSGSGKTTTLRLLAGFESPDSGSVRVDGEDVTTLGPARRRFGMVFQHYALFPHMTVAENVAFGIDRLPRAEQRHRVSEVLDQVHLGGFETRPVTDLSGGQQQRVAVARALAPHPRVLLLDEPLSNLDPTLREQTRTELRASLKAIGITSVFVTHEQEEAFALGDRVAVMRDGALEQAGSAPSLYEEPVSRFVATFVGRASVVPATILNAEWAEVSPGVEWRVRTAAAVEPGTPVDVVVRPEAASFVETGGVGGTISHVRYSGARAYFSVDTEVGAIEVEASIHAGNAGDRVRVTVDSAHAFPAES